MSFKFSVLNPVCEDFYAYFNIKVANNQASFVLKDEVRFYVPEDTLSSHYYLDWSNLCGGPDHHDVQRIDPIWFERIMDDLYIKLHDLIKGKICQYDFSVTA